MTQHGSDAGDSYRVRPVAHRVRIPGFNADAEIGFGDAIKRVTSLVGIRPCEPCRKRATMLNQWMVFHGRR
jgi:hypothetical protein